MFFYTRCTFDYKLEFSKNAIEFRQNQNVRIVGTRYVYPSIGGGGVEVIGGIKMVK